MVFSATYTNISVISWRSVLLVEETGEPGEKHRPVSRDTTLYTLQSKKYYYSIEQKPTLNIHKKTRTINNKEKFKLINSYIMLCASFVFNVSRPIGSISTIVPLHYLVYTWYILFAKAVIYWMFFWYNFILNISAYRRK